MATEYVELRDGGLYLSGTRVSLESIVLGFLRGESPETICQNFDTLKLEEVYGAIAYYLGNQESVETYLAEMDRKWTAAAARVKASPDSLRERLVRTRGEMRTTQSS